jgi:uncharacterized protein YnzC (UPF0291/DUF896 family)
MIFQVRIHPQTRTKTIDLADVERQYLITLYLAAIARQYKTTVDKITIVDHMNEVRFYIQKKN